MVSLTPILLFSQPPFRSFWLAPISKFFFVQVKKNIQVKTHTNTHTHTGGSSSHNNMRLQSNDEKHHSHLFSLFITHFDMFNRHSHRLWNCFFIKKTSFCDSSSSSWIWYSSFLIKKYINHESFCFHSILKLSSISSSSWYYHITMSFF